MKGFSDLLDALLFSPRRNVKLAHLVNWIKTTADPDRGYGLAALTSDLSFRSVKAGVVRELAGQVTDSIYLPYLMILLVIWQKQLPCCGLIANPQSRLSSLLCLRLSRPFQP